ncbi:hypothetical protein BB558_002976 [Smittium angustum]|uniref:Xylanolytic transcriptional activator regulatory domain-containing protein n=1 Tax=Smittium angustum TaxID=133377 RepID=A0A2U1J7C1_SMIAN|nr:hypothetical protein BB558_002976 [Smittium angustum]
MSHTRNALDPSPPQDCPGNPPISPKLPPNSTIIAVVFALLYSSPISMAPLRVPHFIRSLSNNLVPKHLICSFLASGLKYLFPKRSKDQLLLENTYAKYSLDFISENSDSLDINIIWSSLVLSEHYISLANDSLSSQLSGNAFTLAIKLNLHKVDSPKKPDPNITTYFHPEFKRRVWWMSYIYESTINPFSGSIEKYPTFEINVNFPKNDLWWKFGGPEPDCPPNLLSLNTLANSSINNKNKVDHLANFCKLHILASQISSFVNTRWLHKPNNDFYHQLKLYEQQVNQMFAHVDNTYSIKDLSLLSSQNVNPSSVDSIATIEPILFQYSTRIILSNTAMLLFQSELVSPKLASVPKERIVFAKNKCIQYSVEQASLYNKLTKNLQPNMIPAILETRIMRPTLVLLECITIKDHPLKEEINSSYSHILSFLKFSNPYFDAQSNYTNFFDFCKYTRSLFHEQKDFDRHINSVLLNYDSSVSDLFPWILPKLSSIQKLNYNIFNSLQLPNNCNFEKSGIQESIQKENIIPEIPNIQKTSSNHLKIPSSLDLNKLFEIENIDKFSDISFYCSNDSTIPKSLVQKKPIQKERKFGIGSDNQFSMFLKNTSRKKHTQVKHDKMIPLKGNPDKTPELQDKKILVVNKSADLASAAFDFDKIINGILPDLLQKEEIANLEQIYSPTSTIVKRKSDNEVENLHEDVSSSMSFTSSITNVLSPKSSINETMSHTNKLVGKMCKDIVQDIDVQQDLFEIIDDNNESYIPSSISEFTSDQYKKKLLKQEMEINYLKSMINKPEKQRKKGELSKTNKKERLKIREYNPYKKRKKSDDSRDSES